MGNEIVYMSFAMDPAVDVPGQEDIFAVDPDTGRVRRITEDSALGLEFVSDRRPVWSPGRSRIAMYRGVGGDPLVLVLDPDDGSVLEKVGPGFSPLWLTDQRLAFHPASSTARLLTALPGDEPTVLVDLPDGYEMVGVSWHGERGLAFGYEAPSGDNTMIGIIPARVIEQAWSSGTPATVDDMVLYGRPHTSVCLPSWSPDGSRLAVTDYDARNDGLSAMTVAILDMERHTYHPVKLNDGFGSFGPEWSPDGDRLAFIHGQEMLWSELWLYDLDTRVATQLTDDGEQRFKQDLSW